MAKGERPLSPHLQVYKPQISSAMSILHRITGVALSVGTLLFCWWIVSAAVGGDYYETTKGIIGSWFGYLVLFGFTVAFSYHLSNGIRHLAWDAGYGFDLPTMEKTGKMVLGFTAVFTILVWVLALA